MHEDEVKQFENEGGAIQGTVKDLQMSGFVQVGDPNLENLEFRTVVTVGCTCCRCCCCRCPVCGRPLHVDPPAPYVPPYPWTYPYIYPQPWGGYQPSWVGTPITYSDFHSDITF